MAITVSEEAAAALQPEATVVLSVRSPQPLLDALDAGVSDIAALDGGRYARAGPGYRSGPAYVSGPVPVPGGALVLLDVGWTPVELLRTIPGLLARSLRMAGVRDASVELPGRIGDRYVTAQGYGPAARTWLRGPMSFSPGLSPSPDPGSGPGSGSGLDPGSGSAPGSAVPRAAGQAGWFLETVVGWLRARGEPVGVIASVETPLTWETVGDTADAVLEAGQVMAVVAGDLGTSAASGAVGQWYGAVPEAALTEARARWSGDEVAAAMLAQRDVCRSGAERVVWAGVGAVRTARDLLTPRWNPDDRVTRPDVELLGDLAVPDALWCQILSGGHLARLGGPPAGATELPGGRFELTVGEPGQWLPGHRDRPAVLARARELLAPCLLDPAEAFALSRERIGVLHRRTRSG